MTQQPMNSAPSADEATAYLEAVRGRLTADGCSVTKATWGDHQVVLGSRSDRKARWMGTKAELFVLAAAVPEVDARSLAGFTEWAMAFARSVRTGVAGARNAASVLPALISGSVQPEAVNWAAADARLLGATVIGRPITVEVLAPGSARVTVYQGRPMYGGMFTGHVLEKAARYFP
ncbi:hypothetical protein ACIBCB_22635 [Streptomyces uncialis]|uniref:hypothetical protein n=1 Tax=Streptomyces uncialis TaxID=1048205 RepID=UPI002E35DD3F|nr:hypothetical protein [Streptomyces uncialis]WTE13321.1 hypothetical protein OG924_25685 [Streptomyces uncialis]